MPVIHTCLRRLIPASPRTGVALGLGLLLMLSLPLAAGAESWQGKETSVDGVKHILNPSQPMKSPAKVSLNELWRVGGNTDNEDEFFGLITAINADDEGNVYVLDLQLAEVKVYNAEGEYIRSIGREGEGPGEFRFPSGMALMPDGNIGVIQTAPGRIVGLTREGDPAEDYPIPALAEGGGSTILRTGRGVDDKLYLLLQFNEFLQEEGKFNQTLQLTRVNAEGEVLSEFCSDTRSIDFASSVIDEKVWDGFENRWTLGPEGEVYVADTYGEYAISVWGADGTKEAVIKREYDHRKRSDEELEELECIFSAFTRQVPNAEIRISEFDQDIFRLYARDDGSLWVNTSHGSQEELPEGVMGVFDVFDEQGRFVQEVTLEGDGNPGDDAFFFVGDRIYVVTGMLDAAMALQGGSNECGDQEEEPEPMSVICYQLTI